MLLIPNEVVARYTAHLKTVGIPAVHHADYRKWVRYFLDFCDKYPVPDVKSERIRLFCEKLQEKKQSERLREQAAHAVSLYFEMKQSLKQLMNAPVEPGEEGGKEIGLSEGESAAEKPSLESSAELQQSLVSRSASPFREAGYQVRSKSPEWDAVLAQMAAEIKVRHYSRKTLKTYAN